MVIDREVLRAAAEAFREEAIAPSLNALRGVAYEMLGALAERRERGPSRAERLVRYRCAALGALLRMPPERRENGPGTVDGMVDAAEHYAHAMLAAERESSHG